MDPTGDRSHEHDLHGDLAELLACESELDRLLTETWGEAERRIEAARTGAAKAAADLERELEGEASKLRGAITAQADARVQAVLTESRKRRARFEGVSDEEVEALADSALRRLIAPEGRP